VYTALDVDTIATRTIHTLLDGMRTRTSINVSRSNNLPYDLNFFTRIWAISSDYTPVRVTIVSTNGQTSFIIDDDLNPIMFINDHDMVPVIKKDISQTHTFYSGARRLGA
jgi:hypothetical protein